MPDSWIPLFSHFQRLKRAQVRNEVLRRLRTVHYGEHDVRAMIPRQPTRAMARQSTHRQRTCRAD